MTKYRIAVDAMGGDHGICVTLAASIKALENNPDLEIVLVGNKDLLEQELSKFKGYSTRLELKHASETVLMDELPAQAMRNKKDSSMRLACELVRDGDCIACVSAGNTGALMAIARYIIKTIPGISRPAISFPLPTQNGIVHMLDLGANVDCTSEQLFQFAIMGSELVRAVGKSKFPKVGLLNVGSESIKGTEAVKACSNMLSKTEEINYTGFIEGDDIYKGIVDVVVCDGFVGNVALKSSEGLAQMILAYAKEVLNKNFYMKAIGFLFKPLFKEIFSKFDSNKYNGGSLLGLQGVVMKSHGKAGVDTFAKAIDMAVIESKKNVPQRIKQVVAAKLKDPALA